MPEPSDRLRSDRPRLVVSVTASVDGRVALSRRSTLLEPESQQVWRSLHRAGADALLAERHAWIESRHGFQVVLEGSGTFVTASSSSPALPPADADPAELSEAFLPDLDQRRWFVVVDGRGRVRWSHRGDDEVRLLVLVSGQTPLPYLSYLRRENIPYLVAGDERVDLAAALVLLKARLGASCVISEAGGGLNGALLRAGLVDELHVILLPALVGGRDTPSMFDGSALDPSQPPPRLRLVSTRHDHDAIWLHYEDPTRC